MKSFKVSITFDGIEAENPLEAAKKIVEWLKDENDGAENMIFDVMDEATEDAFTVDLADEDEAAVLPVFVLRTTRYKNKKE
jgi:hypothetical protein